MLKDVKRTTYWGGWNIYPGAAWSHHVQGAGVVVAIFEGATHQWITVAVLWTLAYIAYQGFSQRRKEDAAGLDVMDFMVGMAIAIVWFLVWIALGL